MKIRLAATSALVALAGVASAGRAANVYVMSSGDAGVDAAVVGTLVSHGHSATVGVPYSAFDGTQSLAGFQTVYFQANVNWAVSDMPAAGQQALVDWVNAGGRLVTCEWVLWKIAARGEFQTIAPILPTAPANVYAGATTETFTQATASAQINAGLPPSFAVPLDNYGGTQTFSTARPGATTYYTGVNGSPDDLLTGWSRGLGAVFCLSTTYGPSQLADPNGGRLLSNLMGAGSTGCYANCDGSTATPILNVNDFICFQSAFAAGNGYANCDGSTATPVLNVNDFICFQQRFAAGCQ